MNKLILVLFILVSCGENTNKCQSREEAILRCKAEKVSRYWPGQVPKFENDQCEYSYPMVGCY